MHAHRLRLLMRAGAVLLFAMALALIAGTLYKGGPAPASAARSFQDGYPMETNTWPAGDFGYPGGAETPFPTSDYPPPVALTLTFSASATQPPSILPTEESDQAEDLLTPAVTEMTGPAVTPSVTATRAGVTPQPTRTPVVPEQSGPLMDWGLFWIGFSLPVLSASGYVLYLLDRRPELFRRR